MAQDDQAALSAAHAQITNPRRGTRRSTTPTTAPAAKSWTAAPSCERTISSTALFAAVRDAEGAGCNPGPHSSLLLNSLRRCAPNREFPTNTVRTTRIRTAVHRRRVQPPPNGQPATAPGLIEPDHRSAAALDGAPEAGKTPIAAQAIFNPLIGLARAIGGEQVPELASGPSSRICKRQDRVFVGCGDSADRYGTSRPWGAA